MITELTLLEAASALQRGEFSSRELTQASLDRIAALEPELHAFLHIANESALTQADAADIKLTNARRSSLPIPPLLGIPLAVKDVISVENMPCTCGSRILEGYIPPFTATAVNRLQDAGMIIVGKTNTDEFAMGSSTENSAYGVTHNPWDKSRVPGGSSGGSATAVAARLVSAGLGTDTGGSVRQPASFCGVTGLKPTYGRVSRYGLIAYGSSLDCCGVLARNAADAAAVFSVMQGNDPLDATTQDVRANPVELNNEANLQGVRIGIPKEYFIKGIQPDVERYFERANEYVLLVENSARGPTVTKRPSCSAARRWMFSISSARWKSLPSMWRLPGPRLMVFRPTDLLPLCRVNSDGTLHPAVRRSAHFCRVGGGAQGCPRAGLRPPLKLHVRFSRMQLSRRLPSSEMQSKESVEQDSPARTRRRAGVPAAASSRRIASA